MSNFSKYINIPYKHRGRDFSGVDCFGICYLMFKEEKSIIIPDLVMYSYQWYKYGQNHINTTLEEIADLYRVVSFPYRPFDVLIFFSNNNRTIASHLGVCIDVDKFIHAYSGNPSMLSRLEGHYSHRLYKAVRHKDLGD